MAWGSGHGSVDHDGLLQMGDCLDAEGRIVLPPGVTLVSLIDRNIANVGGSVAYRYLDYTRSVDGPAVELTWTELGHRMRAIGAHVQRVASPGALGRSVRRRRRGRRHDRPARPPRRSHHAQETATDSKTETSAALPRPTPPRKIRQWPPGGQNSGAADRRPRGKQRAGTGCSEIVVGRCGTPWR
jgi:hypothetical protein